MAILTTLSGERHQASPADVVFLLLKALPYAIFGGVTALLLAAKLGSQRLGIVLAGLALVALDVSVYVSVIYYPASSTDSIALVTMPAVQVFGVLPLMFALGAVAQWAWGRPRE